MKPMMSRFASLASLLLMMAFCMAQQPTSSPDASDRSSPQSPSSQAQSGQTSSSQNSPKQTAPGQPSAGSTGKGSSSQDPSTRDSSAKGQSIPGSEPDQAAEESSSQDEPTDISPPPGDAKNHPDSKSAVGDLLPSSANSSSDGSGIQEFHPWNPMKAQKDVDVGDYYFRRKNYRAAMDRYKEALYYKENDAIATYRLAVCAEKMGDKLEARKNFEQYLKILPEGRLANGARASLEKLGGKASP
jgi:tetratricopeptide (TPR) repeat protein